MKKLIEKIERHRSLEATPAPAPPQASAKAAVAAAPAAGYKIRGFPKEFEKNFIKSLDRRLMTALAFSLTIVLGSFTLLSSKLITKGSTAENPDLLKKIQERYITKVLQKPVVKEEKKTVAKAEEKKDEGAEDAAAAEEAKKAREAERAKRQEEKAASKGQETKVASAAERRAARDAAAAARRAARAQQEQAAASVGVLGLLTAAGGGEGGGPVVEDVLSGVGGTANLDAALGNVGGLKVASGKGERTEVKGRTVGKAAAGGGIDELVTGLGAAGSKSLARTGDIKVAGPSEIGGSSAARKEASRSDETISEVIQEHQQAIDYCYQQEVKRNPDLKGDVTVRFTIEWDGKVSDVQVVNSTLKNAKVERCIVDRIRRWEFPSLDNPSKGKITIKQKFIFG